MEDRNGKGLEKTRNGEEISDVSDFKCFLQQNRTPTPYSLYFTFLYAVSTFDLLNSVSSISFLLYSLFHLESREEIFSQSFFKGKHASSKLLWSFFFPFSTG